MLWLSNVASSSAFAAGIYQRQHCISKGDSGKPSFSGVTVKGMFDFDHS